MIIHIGFPRCASTTLQYLFDKSDVNFLGCNPKAKLNKFYHSSIGSFFESTLRFGTDKHFDDNCESVKEFLLKESKLNNIKTILSYENICFRLTPWDLPTDIKIKRLGLITPKDSTILVSFRNPKNFLISLFKNHVSFGYTETFNIFIKELFILKDFGWFLDLKLDYLTALLLKHTNASNIIFLNIDVSANIKKLLEKLSINTRIDNIPFSNKSINLVENESARLFNKNKVNSRYLLDWLEIHRTFPNSNLPNDFIFDISRNRIKQSEYISMDNNNHNYLLNDFEWPDIVEDLSNSNQIFLDSTVNKKIILIK